MNMTDAIVQNALLREDSLTPSSHFDLGWLRHDYEEDLVKTAKEKLGSVEVAKS